MSNTALITGASAGIGMALAALLAEKGINLVLVARREERLKEIKSSLEQKNEIDISIIAIDLTKPGAADEITAILDNKNIRVDYLINNAGFSRQGFFHETDPATIESMITLNVMASVSLTRKMIPRMLEQKQGRILNVASSAAFAPGGPMQSIYYATKSFLVSFSRGLAGELAGTGITVTALCPGATATEFEQISGLDKTNLFTTEKVFSAEEVAQDGYDAMMKGELVRLSALTPMNKFVLKHMSLFPAKKILEQIRRRQEVVK